MHKRTSGLLTCLVPTLLVVGLAGCGAVPPSAGGPARPSTSATAPNGDPGSGDPSSEPGAERPDGEDSPAPVDPAVKLSANVANRAKAVAVNTVVTAKASGGRLTAAVLTWQGPDSKGVLQKGTVKGALAKDGARWTAGDRLEPGATYTLKLTGQNGKGTASSTTSTFSTQKLTLAQQTFPELYPLADTTVGVGMPVVLRFDVAVKDRKTFQQHLKVVSTPAQTGTWHWYSDTLVHYRPKNYWKPGTKVAVTADLNGLAAGNGIYGQRSTTTTFRVGQSVVTKVDLKSHRAKVYIGGDLARTIAISAGKSGWQTRSGTKIVSDKLAVTRMTNEMIGADEAYDLKVRYAIRITNSGEFLHAAPWNSANMGRANASHGCVGMNTGDAAWLFQRIKVGDPVITTGSSRGLEEGNGYTDWNVSWSSYQKGSAA